MTRRKLLFVCPDFAPAAGGIRVLYRHVDVLNEAGFEAAILHHKSGFRCHWFENSTRVLYLDSFAPAPRDIAVIPEIYGPMISRILPQCKKVVFNQNSYLTFQGCSFDATSSTSLYDDPNLLAILTVSADNESYLRFAFPHLRTIRLHYSIDSDLFQYRWPKDAQIAFMPRKNAGDALQVVSILRQRRSLGEVRIVPIDNVSERDVAGILQDSLAYLSFGHPEGCPLPPMEAMACGCIVIGYQGNGGREYFLPSHSFPIPLGDIVHFVRTVETVLRTDHAELRPLSERASQFIRAHYSVEREQEDIVPYPTLIAFSGECCRFVIGLEEVCYTGNLAKGHLG